jgi:putative transposase
MTKLKIPFEPDSVYHVYHHANGREDIFRETNNYFFFLRKYKAYFSEILDTYAYCLLPNHFHFLIKFHESEKLLTYFQSKTKPKTELTEENLYLLLSNQFKYFLISYSKSYNKYYSRKGSLFIESLQRKKVDNEDYFASLIRYIHFNPVYHRFTDHPLKWRFSSLYDIRQSNSGIINLNTIYQFFGGRNRLIEFHKKFHADEIDKIKHLL